MMLIMYCHHKVMAKLMMIMSYHQKLMPNLDGGMQIHWVMLIELMMMELSYYYCKNNCYCLRNVIDISLKMLLMLWWLLLLMKTMMMMM